MNLPSSVPIPPEKKNPAIGRHGAPQKPGEFPGGFVYSPKEMKFALAGVDLFLVLPTDRLQEYARIVLGGNPFWLRFVVPRDGRMSGMSWW
jgi:hypothetical protein